MNAGRRFIFRRALMMLALTGLDCASALHGQTKPYPDRAVRLVNSNPPGGPSGLVTRALAEPFRTRFGQSPVVENRLGPGGNIGSELVAKSSPDGLTLLIVTDTVVTVNAETCPFMRYIRYSRIANDD